jgi:hypothetical protein
VTNTCAVRAKIKAVIAVLAIIFGPFIIALAFLAPISALITALGVVAAAASATSIQFWFRGQAERSQLRRRQNSSLIATLAEALSSFNWAAAGALAPASTWLAVIFRIYRPGNCRGASSGRQRGIPTPTNTTPTAMRRFGPVRIRRLAQQLLQVPGSVWLARRTSRDAEPDRGPFNS